MKAPVVAAADILCVFAQTRHSTLHSSIMRDNTGKYVDNRSPLGRKPKLKIVKTREKIDCGKDRVKANDSLSLLRSSRISLEVCKKTNKRKWEETVIHQVYGGTRDKRQKDTRDSRRKCGKWPVQQ
jgi:hypothetical protein